MRAVVCHESKLEVEDSLIPYRGGDRCCSRSSVAASAARTCMRASTPTSSRTWPPGSVHDVMRPHESVVMGHEFSGRVLDYGPSTRNPWASGTPVVSLPMIRVRGKVQMTGLSAKAPGAYAERVLVQESLTMDVPNGLSAETAALTEPMAVAWHAVRRSAVRKRETAVVDRVRTDRAGRDPDAQGSRGQEGRRQRLLTRPASARRASAAPTW